MPQTVIMQALSTAFATIMTVTVISFPTPRDLKDTVFPPGDTAKAEIVDGGIAPNLPAAIDETKPGELADQLDVCVDSLSAAVPFGIETCRDTIMAAGSVIAKLPPGNELDEKLKLATALYCRVEWVETAAAGRGFDLKSCEGIALALAN